MSDAVIFGDGSIIMLAGVYDPSITGKGNPWHDPRTGRFTFGPPGVKILRGVQSFRMMDSATKRIIDGRTKLFNNRVDGIIADPHGDKVRINMFVGGKLVDKFDVPGPKKKGRLKRGEEAIDQGIPASDPRRVEYEHVMRDLRVYGEYLQVGEKKSDDPFRRHLSPDERDRQQDLRERLGRLVNDGVFRREPEDVLEEIELTRASDGRKHFNPAEREKLQAWRDSLLDTSSIDRAAESVSDAIREMDTPKASSEALIDDEHAESKIRRQVEDLVGPGPERDGAQEALEEMYHEAYDKENKRLAKIVDDAGVDKAVVGSHVYIRPDLDDPLMEIEDMRRGVRSRRWTVHLGDPGYEYAEVPQFTVLLKDDKWEVWDMASMDDFREMGVTEAEQEEYFKLVNAVRGRKPGGFSFLHRGMSRSEWEAWERGEEIPAGKWFTSEKTVERAADIEGVFPELFTVKIRNEDVVEVDEGSFQLVRPMVMKRKGVLHPVGSALPEDFDKPDEATVTGIFDEDREWVAPPSPKALGRGRGGAGGYSADKSFGTNTRLGEEGEKIFAAFTGGEQLNVGSDRRGAFDVVVGDYAFEVKANSTAATEYKATPKKGEIRAKRKWAKENGKTPAIAMPIIDTDSGMTFIYWRPGIKGGRLSKERGWKYLGSIEHTKIDDVDVPEPDEYAENWVSVPAPDSHADRNEDKPRDTAPGSGREAPKEFGAIVNEMGEPLDQEEFKAVRAWVKEQGFEEWYFGLDEDHRDALEQYVAYEQYPFINNPLRDDEELLPMYQDIVARMDEALASAPELKEDVYAWRGVWLGDSRAMFPKAGEEFDDKGFVSTSLARGLADTFADYEEGEGAMLKVLIPKGSRVGFLDPDYQEHLKKPGHIIDAGQLELLIPRGGRFRMKSRKGNVWEVEYVSPAEQQQREFKRLAKGKSDEKPAEEERFGDLVDRLAVEGNVEALEQYIDTRERIIATSKKHDVYDKDDEYFKMLAKDIASLKKALARAKNARKK